MPTITLTGRRHEIGLCEIILREITSQKWDVRTLSDTRCSNAYSKFRSFLGNLGKSGTNVKTFRFHMILCTRKMPY